MSFEQWGALLGVAATLIVAITGLLKVIVDAVALRKKSDPEPAPEVGIPATPDTDIDIRAYEDMQADRDKWRDLYLGNNKHDDPER
ncbi:hypothetical protein [Microbacterium sp. UBA837]|uniref:hypothetical protein n=1 Tax=Microbacterium sp. UBA837 TaxID=1946956 RepID=UPI0025F67EAC|nr:hypothetical protein [Microbacterium sp. UBA837]|tara:strand:- start:2542 stop:2799 length:258 start_codon:yes stop_codon:yes gene_type:complete